MTGDSLYDECVALWKYWVVAIVDILCEFFEVVIHNFFYYSSYYDHGDSFSGFFNSSVLWKKNQIWLHRLYVPRPRRCTLCTQSHSEYSSLDSTSLLWTVTLLVETNALNQSRTVHARGNPTGIHVHSGKREYFILLRFSQLFLCNTEYRFTSWSS